MSNYITIELCAEDRARLDRLAEALERRTCDKCVTSAIDYLKNAPELHTEEVTAEQETPIVEGTVQAEHF
jgi:predicted transcriptional regulator